MGHSLILKPSTQEKSVQSSHRENKGRSVQRWSTPVGNAPSHPHALSWRSDALRRPRGSHSAARTVLRLPQQQLFFLESCLFHNVKFITANAKDKYTFISQEQKKREKWRSFQAVGKELRDFYSHWEEDREEPVGTHESARASSAAEGREQSTSSELPLHSLLSRAPLLSLPAPNPECCSWKRTSLLPDYTNTVQ